MLPGGASKPVWRIALLPLLAPERMSVLFQQDHPRTFQGEAAGHGATHHASADHCNVEDRGLCRKRLSHRFCLFLWYQFAF